jgi:hypothetical protein
VALVDGCRQAFRAGAPAESDSRSSAPTIGAMEPNPTLTPDDDRAMDSLVAKIRRKHHARQDAADAALESFIDNLITFFGSPPVPRTAAAKVGPHEDASGAPPCGR